MKIQFVKECLLLLTCAGVTCEVVNATPVTVPDFSFENTTNITAAGGATGAPDVGPSWHASGNGGVFIQDMTNGLDFNGPPLPAPADGTNYINERINGSTARIWQNLGPLKSNTVYTLTVAVGNALVPSTGQGSIGLVNGVSPFGTLLGSTPLDSTAVTPGSFTDYSFVFTNGYQASGSLMILLEGDTGTEILYDNVRLDAANTPAAAAALPISISPSNTVFAGTSVTLTENPSGTPSFFYQWQTDNGSGGATWSNTGGNTTNLVVDTTSFTPSVPVQYQVIVTNSSGASTSAPVALTAINGQPVVTSDTVPALGSDVVGSSVTFSAQFDGTRPIGYQWFTVDLNNNTTMVDGATNTTLTITNLQLSNYAFYYLQASNSLGIVTSTERLFVVSNPPPADVNGVVISPANQSGLGGNTQYSPTWSVVTNGDLLLGLAPTVAGGNFQLESCGGTPFMTDGQFGFLPPQGNGSVFLATCGNSDNQPGGQGAPGTNLIYTLPPSTNGWDLTNITVYGGWSDTGRDQQRYMVYYSTVSNPTNFNTIIADVNFNPDNTTSLPGVQSATRTSVSSTNGVLARGVAAVKFFFYTLANGVENGYSGYAEFQTFGVPSLPLPVFQGINPASGFDVVGGSITITGSFSSTTPVTYQWLKDGAPIGGATNTALTLTNLQVSDTSQSPGYVLQASNVTGVVSSTAVPFVVNPTPAPDGSGVIDSLAGQTGNSSLFTPTWSIASGSLIAGTEPTTAIYGGGNFNDEGAGGVPILTDGQFGHVGSGNNSTLATAGNGGAGHTVIYTFPAGSGAGFNISNIVTYGGWGDNGRNAQDYTVSYSTVFAPSTFIPLDAVAQDPGFGAVPNGARVTLAPGSGAFLATNVYAVEFDFTTPTDKNGYQGYSELQIFGAAAPSLTSLAPGLAQDILPATGSDVVGSSVTFKALFTGTAPVLYQWYQGGNPISGATGATLTLNNLQLTNSGNYSVAAYNTFGTNSSSTNTFTVNPAPTAVNGTLDAQAYQSGYANLGLTPTWALTPGSLIAGQLPSSVGGGNFGNEGCGGANVLTDGSPGSYASGNHNLASCGPSAGTSVTYNLSGSASGYDLSGIAVYGGWADAGRNENGFAVTYATASNPGTFVSLTSPQTTFDYKPGGPAIANANRQVVSSATASPLAQNVVAVKITFNSEENGWCGFGQVQLFGSASVVSASPKFSSATLSGGNLIMVGSGGSPGVGYTLLSTTNVALPISAWVTNTTGTFDNGGAFSNALGVTSTSNRFFLLRTP